MTPVCRCRALAAALAVMSLAAPALAQQSAADRTKAKARTPPPAAARVEFVRGGAVAGPRAAPARPALRGAAASAAPLEAGSALTEGTRIQVPEDGYLRLRLADGSVVRVLAESDVELRRLRRRGPPGATETVIDVRRGKVESDVAPQQKGRVFEIRAPGAVASVRGTRFDVAIDSEGRVSTAVTEGTVSLQAHGRRQRAAQRTLVTAGQGVVVDAVGRLGQHRPLPPVPDLSGLPAEHQDANLLTLDLGPPPGLATGYDVRIGQGDELLQVVRSAAFSGPRAQFAALEDGQYTVSVRALDRDGLAGPEARAPLRVRARPVPPLYQSPPQGAHVTSEAGQLVCSPTAGAKWVHLQVARSADFSQLPLAIDEPQLSDCRFGLLALAPGEYHWRVASVVDTPGGGTQQGPFAAAQTFTVAPTPVVSALEAPDDNDTPTLRWQAAPGLHFRGELARDAAFTQPLLSAELDQPSWTLRGLARGSYFVRLQARDAAGLTGPFSPPHRVRIGNVVQSGAGGAVTSSDGEPVGRP
jgi:hypothetical protein